MFGNYGYNSNVRDMEPRALERRLGLDACCNGIYDEPPRKREVDYAPNQEPLKIRDGSDYASMYDAVMNAAERAGMLRGDPPPSWYENPSNLGSVVLAGTAVFPYLVQGLSSGIE
ncbi:hypothetical protein WALSEDRAFT_34173 [Wallemia mellicola CBS 633.66]|uniref:Uncharacterized protein n=1 Tax=Wallemia mellicola (strain ATCC MYA-4683 / CBS 633.66) TaxID=671144 RepID=I4Y5R5_WALMC|nr:hypothetical protein WALSEDRAFT_34173 [Wallemia mellicola CBS 633.66]EIM19307.1 hypothetical protein WALSEDRAFT_34173 [Wallemia mellicola CBS 633.66]|eukprot:XP_006960699.1 hypothetical protein WALSEDRAFT_34173 [Wallemia mellicola CBS 633.66]